MDEYVWKSLWWLPGFSISMSWWLIVPICAWSLPCHKNTAKGKKSPIIKTDFGWLELCVYCMLDLHQRVLAKPGHRDGKPADCQCWLERKEKLNENIARVCAHHAHSLLLPGNNLQKLKRFLHVDKMANCINEKVPGTQWCQPDVRNRDMMTHWCQTET